jgi:hypothetical protein
MHEPRKTVASEKSLLEVAQKKKVLISGYGFLEACRRTDTVFTQHEIEIKRCQSSSSYADNSMANALELFCSRQATDD